MKTIVIALGALLVLASCNQDKTAYVDNTVLLKEYKEMKDTEAKYNTMAEAMKKEMDSVAKQWEKITDRLGRDNQKKMYAAAMGL